MGRQEKIADELDFIGTGVIDNLVATIKTANYTVTPEDFILIANSNTEVCFALPAASTINNRAFIFLCRLDAGMSIRGIDTDSMVTLNLATSDSVSYTNTGNHSIGAACMIVCAANSYYLTDLCAVAAEAQAVDA